MATWTPQYSTLLSQILDILFGTQDVMETRQDYCKLDDCICSTVSPMNRYYTGSKAEGLDLPGSDDDYMYEINSAFNIEVVQSLDKNTSTSPYNTFLMLTENIRPGFTLLKHVSPTPLNPFLSRASQEMNGSQYLRGDLFVQQMIEGIQGFFCGAGLNDVLKMHRQGPSKETANGLGREPDDNVDCIRCSFWPSEASEWRDRPRHFGWPTQDDLMSITNFGFHLVAVGHPNSQTKLFEWRISFSIAERILVWSFNHVQMQCYALMKIILKQFIKVRCNPHNQILCSYFIKTFLFWKYETTEVNFWREDNIRECIKYLFTEFSKCIREGSLRHYFIPRFNLLSVKLTPEAQRELLQLFDIVIESDIGILKDCGCLKDIWSGFLQIIAVRNDSIASYIRSSFSFKNDQCIFQNFELLKHLTRDNLCWLPNAFNKHDKVFRQVLSLSCKTPLRDLVLKCLLFHKYISSATHTVSPNNRCMYDLLRKVPLKMCSFDISTCKLTCAILLYKAGDYQSTLAIINQVLSNIPPFVMHRDDSLQTRELYKDVYWDSSVTIIQKAKTAWMLPMDFHQKDTSLPLAIRIELYFHRVSVRLSPFTCAYYLQFLCYFDLHQYENRDRALEQLVDFEKTAAERVTDGESFSDLNIAGHCLLLAGKIAESRDMFYLSYALVQQFLPEFQVLNSARWYLQNFF